MKKLKTITFTNTEWTQVKLAYVKFYKTNNKCSDTCPAESLMHQKIGDKFQSYDEMDNMSYCQLCNQFKEFKSLHDSCPCHQFNEKAFVQLEKLITRWIKENEIKI